MDKATLEKIFEYASMPVHGTLSRKIRKGVKIQIDNGEVIEEAVIFLGEQFVRLTRTMGSETVNTYYAWDKIAAVTTYGETG
jgi:hypothetical protein